MTTKTNWEYIDSFLIGESETDDLPENAKEEIKAFLPNHDFGVFSDDTLDMLSGIWELAGADGYEETVGERIPNVFSVIAVPNSEEAAEDSEDER